MSELKVRITGDAAGFQQTLNMAKTDAAKFNQSLMAQSKQAAESNKRIAAGGQFVSKGIAVSNAASSLGNVPGLGAAGGAVGAAAGAFFGLKEGAQALGTSMLKMSGLLAAFAFTITMLNKLYKEAYGISEVLTEQLRTEVDSHNQQMKSKNAYIDVLKQNAGSLRKEEYERLRKGVLNGDESAKAEVRKRFGGTALNKELIKDLAKAQIEAMPDGAKKKLAQEDMRFRGEIDSLRGRIGDSPSDATRRIASQMVGALWAEHSNNVSDIQKQQLEELRQITTNTKESNNSKYSVNPFK